MSKFKVVSLFSGAGGLDLGLVQTGKFKIIFANDILESSLITYSRNIGLKFVKSINKNVKAREGVALVSDVSKVDFSAFDTEADLVIGGPPCQDFSIIRGKYRGGIKVKRGKLYEYFVKALKMLKPNIFVFENVAGLVSANNGLAYKVILKDFTSAGYELIFADLVNFANLGVPQKRERLIIIGIRRDLIEDDIMVLWCVRSKIEKVLRGEKWLFRKYPLTSIEVFEGDRLDNLNDVYIEVMKKWDGIWKEVGTERAYEWKEKVWDKLSFDIINDYLFINNIKYKSSDELEVAFVQHEALLKELKYYKKPVYKLNLPDGTTKIPFESASVLERMKRIPPDENYEFVEGTVWSVKGGRISQIYRRIHPLKPSYTITAYGGGGTHGYHYDRDRSMLTLREKARLQTFPDEFLFYGNEGEIKAQIGEAVPPLAGKRIGEVIVDILKTINN